MPCCSCLHKHILHHHWTIKPKFTKLTSQHAPCAMRGEHVLIVTDVLWRCCSGGRCDLSGLGRMNRYWIHVEAGTAPSVGDSRVILSMDKDD